MSTFAVTNSSQVIDSVNYLLSNLDTSTVTGNVTIPDGTLVANVTTGQITATGNVTAGANSYSYINQYINLRYANNASGSSGFSTLPTNSQYFGVYNSNIATASSNPAEYVWRQVSGGFGTTKTIYYSSIGGRQVQFAAANVAPSSNFVVSVANVAIDLDVITTAAGLPGERGPIAMAYVITTADPATASSSTLTGWFSAARDALTPPIGTGLTPVTGDTAYFTYPTTGSSVTYEYNGSAWTSVIGQVVSGNVVVGNSLPGSAVIDESLAGDKLLNSTITGNKITTNTITGNLITVGTLTGNLIAANTITGNTIQVGTLTGNLIAANTITGTNIVGNTITGNLIAANTISGNSIVANSITSTQISSAYIYAGNIVSFGASLGNTSSSGYWLQYNTGNARFGGNVSIGANLTVAGLITTGNLIANTVQTTTITANAVSDFSVSYSPVGTTQTGVVSDQWNYLTNSITGNAIININSVFGVAAQTVYLGGSTLAEIQFNAVTSYNILVSVGLFQRVYPSTYTQIYNLREQTFTGTTTGVGNVSVQADFVGYSDYIANSSSPYGYTYGIRIRVVSGTVNSLRSNFDNYNLQAQVLKR